MSNTFTYKNFDLYMMLTGTFGGGGYYLSPNREAYMTNGSGLFNSNSIYIPWWTLKTKVMYIPQLYSLVTVVASWVYKAELSQDAGCYIVVYFQRILG